VVLLQPTSHRPVAPACAAGPGRSSRRSPACTTGAPTPGWSGIVNW